MLQTITPTRLVLELEANGPGATMSRRAWHVLASLLRLVDPDSHDVDISHRALALRGAYCSPRTVSRALSELVAAGLVEHTHGGRTGHGSTDVRVSYVRVWVEAVETLLDAGREYVRNARREAWTLTQARMRTLLDWRARGRARNALVGALDELLDVALEADERQTRRSAVMDRLSTSPPGPGPAPGGERGFDPYIVEICQHDWQRSQCRRCKDAD